MKLLHENNDQLLQYYFYLLDFIVTFYGLHTGTTNFNFIDYTITLNFFEVIYNNNFFFTFFV